VGDVVFDPRMELFQGATRIGSNDNWSGTLELITAFTEVGAFALPLTSRDAAVIATLEPGNYTVRVEGVNDALGMALIEVYELP
jgi:hypothetical protein